METANATATAMTTVIATATTTATTTAMATATATATATTTKYDPRYRDIQDIDSYLSQTHYKYKLYPLVLTSFNVDNRHLRWKHCKYKFPHNILLAERTSKI